VPWTSNEFFGPDQTASDGDNVRDIGTKDRQSEDSAGSSVFAPGTWHERDILDGRFIDGVGETKQTEGDSTSHYEPDGPDRGLGLGIDMREELGEWESTVPSESPCLATGR
jgi:hypothetical protein